MKTTTCFLQEFRLQLVLVVLVFFSVKRSDSFIIPPVQPSYHCIPHYNNHQQQQLISMNPKQQQKYNNNIQFRSLSSLFSKSSSSSSSLLPLRQSRDSSSSSNSNSDPNNNRKKKKIAVLGGGGYTGGLVCGYLQRCSNLSYQTGIQTRQPRCIGATADTAVRLNRLLSKHFVLSYMDESYYKLTNLLDPIHVSKQLMNYDMIVFSIDDLFIQKRSVTFNTYEKSANDKAWEIYWGSPVGSSFYMNEEEQNNENQIKKDILHNFIEGAKRSKNIQHAFFVGSNQNKEENIHYMELLRQAKIPYTFIITSPDTYTTATPNYTYQKGIQNDITITPATQQQQQLDNANADSTSTLPSSSMVLQPICLEDLAAVCVQAIQSVTDYTKNHILYVSSNGPLLVDLKSASSITTTSTPKLRMDQQWCVNSNTIKMKLEQVL